MLEFQVPLASQASARALTVVTCLISWVGRGVRLNHHTCVCVCVCI